MSPIIVWFRQDLRLKDNPALTEAYKKSRSVLPLYILDDKNSGEWKMGAASRWWLYQSLKSLNESLKDKLCLAKGNAQEVLLDIAEKTGADRVYWNRCYEPWRIARDSEVKNILPENNIEVKSFNGSVLFEPHTTLKDDGMPYKVFTPFYKKTYLGTHAELRSPEEAPKNLKFHSCPSLALKDLDLLPEIQWYDTMDKIWKPGEAGAQARLHEFLDNGLKGYKEGRKFPGRPHVSRLSPHLHFGEISPNEVFYATKEKMMTERCETDGDHFLSELGWREFSNNLLFYFPDLPRENLQKKFDSFPWEKNEQALERWQKGQTGYPIVDAGMRELWQTGYMHNRVRMIVGSFLVKNLLLHWQHGEEWFWDTLVDADLANNAASWQWIAGCGADAAPYFRIFNPVTQGQKFDPSGEYIRRYVPEIAKLPDKFLYSPWDAPDDFLNNVGIELGTTYPKPIVDLKYSRERALAAFKQIKS